MKLSIIMMIRNEEKHLDAVLKSVSEILYRLDSELIIVDTGSVDNSVEIAKKYTSKVYYHEWNDDFSSMRNKTISYAKGEWLFVLDGDEIIENPANVVEFINSRKSKKYNAVSIRFKNITKQSDDNEYGEAWNLRLFRKTKSFKYIGKIHEQPMYKTPIYQSAITILHYGYNSEDPLLMERKFKRNKHLLEEEIEKDPHNVYNLYQLSVTFAMHNDNPDALKWARKAYEAAKNEGGGLLVRRMYLYTNLAHTLILNNEYVEAERICKEAISLKDRYIDLYFFLGLSQTHIKDNKNAICSLKKYLTLLKELKEDKLETVHDPSTKTLTITKKEDAFLMLAELYYRENNIEASLSYINKITEKKIIKQSSALVIDILTEGKHFEHIIDFYNDKIENINSTVLSQAFCELLERKKNTLDSQDQIKFIRTISNLNNDYGLLNQFRLDSTLNNAVFEKVDFNYVPGYYGEIIYSIMNDDKKILSLVEKTREEHLKSILTYIKYKNRDSIVKVLELLHSLIERKEDSRLVAKAVKILSSVYILENKAIDSAEKSYLIKNYIEYGIKHINYSYNRNIIEEAIIYDVKNEEDVFLLHLSCALQKDANDKMYIKHLRHAVKAFPKGSDVIDYVLSISEKHKGQTNIEASNSILVSQSDEFIALKRKLKDKIISLINEEYLSEAKRLIIEYEGVIGEEVDIELYSIKAVIQIKEGSLEEAEALLLDGLDKDNSNFDLYYNLAYCYQIKMHYIKAIKMYSEAKSHAHNDKLIKHINDVLDEINDIMHNDNMIKVKDIQYPKITVIIPTYNQKENLRQAIESCLNQDYPNMEIIVGDDCSTDGTHLMMKEFSSIEKVKYIRNRENLGAGKNPINILYNHADGEYGMFLDHDDCLIDNTYLSLAVDFLRNNKNVAFVWANCIINNEITGKKSYTKFDNKPITNGLEYFLNYEKKGYPHITGILTTVFDMRKLKSTNYGYDTKHMDLFLYLKLMLAGDVGFIERCVCSYRIHKNSISINMPKWADKTTLNQLHQLKEQILDQKVFNKYQLNEWIKLRIYSYILWRCQTMLYNKDRKGAMELLYYISEDYPVVYNAILEKLTLTNKVH
ncbi:glycosyltransferase family 2 protein [Evansella clarkii]|uniref:glycosyltransferase family 2 protein n=1 Tax=Evansella clarkii TaxID=79879 RepID=UPI000997B600|nr:glycosyltransferase [Evansella clarkii]